MGDKYIPSQAHRPRRTKTNLERKLKDLHNAGPIPPLDAGGNDGAPGGGMRGSDQSAVEDEQVRRLELSSGLGNFQSDAPEGRARGLRGSEDPFAGKTETYVLMRTCGMTGKLSAEYHWSCAGPLDARITPMGEHISGTDGAIRYYFFKTMAARDRFSRAIWQERQRMIAERSGG